MNIIVYSREGCHLCDELIVYIEQKNSNYKLSIVDISTDKKLENQYSDFIPVVYINDSIFFAPIDYAALAQLFNQ